MDRAYESGAVASPPSAPASPSIGYPTNGNPGGGVSATIPGEWFFHMMAEEIRKVITDAGITPDHEDLGQLSAAISALAAATFCSDAEAQALSILDKAISPGRLDSAFKGGNQSLAASGYQKLPGGLILQWGAVSHSTGSGSITVSGTFPLTFPTSAVAMSAINIADPVDALFYAGVTLTTTGFSGNLYDYSGGAIAAGSLRYFALGY